MNDLESLWAITVEAIQTIIDELGECIRKPEVISHKDAYSRDRYVILVKLKTDIAQTKSMNFRLFMDSNIRVCMFGSSYNNQHDWDDLSEIKEISLAYADPHVFDTIIASFKDWLNLAMLSLK